MYSFFYFQCTRANNVCLIFYNLQANSLISFSLSLSLSLHLSISLLFFPSKLIILYMLINSKLFIPKSLVLLKLIRSMMIMQHNVYNRFRWKIEQEIKVPKYYFLLNIKFLFSFFPEKTNINLWSYLRQCIGKELTKITMPVQWNEPLSLLQVTEKDVKIHLNLVTKNNG